MYQRRQWHSTPVLLPGKSHGWRSLIGCSPWGRWGSDTTEWLHFHFSLSCIGEGNGNPLQCSCLENPRDGGAWWAAVYGVTHSRTWLMWLSSSSILSLVEVQLCFSLSTSFCHILPFVSIPSSQFWHIWEQEPGINHVWVFCSNLAGAQIMLVLLMSSHYYTVFSILNSHFKNLSTTLTHCINFPCLGHFVHLIFRTTQFLVFHYSSRP